jgi:hypothetical protein
MHLIIIPPKLALSDFITHFVCNACSGQRRFSNAIEPRLSHAVESDAIMSSYTVGLKASQPQLLPLS